MPSFFLPHNLMQIKMNTNQAFHYSNVIYDNDVICGRGGASNKHKGNIFFRELVAKHKQKYLASNKVEKKLIAKFIVDAIRRNGGRFLKLDEAMEITDIGDISAMEKTCQALREGLKIRANKKNKWNEDKNPQVTFTESSSSSCSQHPLPARQLSYSTNSRDYNNNMIFTSQKKNNTTHAQTDTNDPHHNYCINSNRQEYFHVKGIQNRNQNQNFTHNFEYNKSSQCIGRCTSHGQLNANNPNFSCNVNSNRQGYMHAQHIQYGDQNQNLEDNFEYSKPVQYIGRCTCKKSNCLKLYCQCFANSVHCSSEECRCTNCYNSMRYNELVHQAKKKKLGDWCISQQT